MGIAERRHREEDGEREMKQRMQILWNAQKQRDRGRQAARKQLVQSRDIQVLRHKAY